jgi:enoyl-CoA hydratase/carnithine racemase
VSAVIAKLDDGVLTVTLNRADQRNALSLALQRELAELWRTTSTDASVRCVVLTGAGPVFCAGADRDDLAEMTAPGFHRIEFCPSVQVDVPVLVAVNGPCIGAGLRLLADADLAIASDRAWFSDPHVTLGQLATPVALALAEKGSAVSVAQLFLSGNRFQLPADRALAAGLVSEVVPAAQVASRAAKIAASIAAQSPSAVRATVGALRRRHRAALDAQLELAWADVVAQRAHPEATAAAVAIANGRAPVWKPKPEDFEDEA